MYNRPNGVCHGELGHVSRPSSGGSGKQIARDLRSISTAIDADATQAAREAFDEKRRPRFPVITQSWLNAGST